MLQQSQRYDAIRVQPVWFYVGTSASLVVPLGKFSLHPPSAAACLSFTPQFAATQCHVWLSCYEAAVQIARKQGTSHLVAASPAALTWRPPLSGAAVLHA